MSFNRRESADWAIAVDTEAGKLLDTVSKELADGAARGFAKPPGDTLASILAIGQAVKGKLAELDVKLHESRRGIIYQEEEYALSVLVRLAKLGMELYREQLFNALAVEQACQEAQRDRALADVERLDFETELRQRAIIMARAEMERRITVLKGELIDEETITLDSERTLIAAELATAERRLSVIDAIYQVLAAEKLLAAAETVTMGQEEVLINAQLATAEKKLEIIDAIYAVIAAERLVLVAQQATLPIDSALVDAQLVTAAKKLEIIGATYDILAAEELVVNAKTTVLGAEEELLNAQLTTAQKKLEIIGAIYQVLATEREVLTAEMATMGAERSLVNAQLTTAEKKLEIIDSIYQILAAEELVLAAEQRRADALTRVLAAELITAGVKREMIPYYIQKAEAREALAAAITAEIPITEAIIRLGYDRIELERAKEDAAHLERLEQIDMELLREQYTRATTALEFARLQNRRLLLKYHNEIQALILEQQKALKKDEIQFQLDTRLDRERIGVNNEVAVTQHEIANLTNELLSILSNMENRAIDRAATVKDGALKISRDFTVRNISRKIVEGFVVGPMPRAEIG